MTARYYRCSHGHDLAAPRDLDACPAYRHGQPCRGELVAVDAAGRRRREQ
ncbi:MAG: hypothetical protein U5K30_01455 [Acidimicrobiales bacterium]|nr:hypothetical protein [Acidimicrobiales bacterium]